MEQAISPGSCFPWQTSAFLLCLQRNRSQKAFQLMRRCGLPAENLSRSPMLTRFAYRYSPRFGREILAENAPHHLFGLLSACHVWDDCPLLPFRLPGSVHDWFSASLPSDASHTGRGGCLHEPEKMTGILGIRRSFFLSKVDFVCQVPIGNHASFRNGSWQMVMGVTRPGLHVFPDKSPFLTALLYAPVSGRKSLAHRSMFSA